MANILTNKINRYRERRTAFLSAYPSRSLSFLIATWFGSGLLIPGPGTWGTLAGLICGYILLLFTNTLIVAALCLILFIVGLRAIKHIETTTHDHDQSFIVIDEVVAILMVLICIPSNIIFVIIGFILFRLFDIWKPWPIRWVDRRVKGPWGVMLDDVLAALFAIIVFWVGLFAVAFQTISHGH